MPKAKKRVGMPSTRAKRKAAEPTNSVKQRKSAVGQVDQMVAAIDAENAARAAGSVSDYSPENNALEALILLSEQAPAAPSAAASNVASSETVRSPSPVSDESSSLSLDTVSDATNTIEATLVHFHQRLKDSYQALADLTAQLQEKERVSALELENSTAKDTAIQDLQQQTAILQTALQEAEQANKLALQNSAAKDTTIQDLQQQMVDLQTASQVAEKANALTLQKNAQQAAVISDLQLKIAAMKASQKVNQEKMVRQCQQERDRYNAMQQACQKDMAAQFEKLQQTVTKNILTGFGHAAAAAAFTLIAESARTVTGLRLKVPMTALVLLYSKIHFLPKTMSLPKLVHL